MIFFGSGLVDEPDRAPWDGLAAASEFLDRAAMHVAESSALDPVLWPKPVSDDDLTLMRRIDEIYMKWPFYGPRKMVEELRDERCDVNRKRVRRLMRLMGIEACLRRRQSAHKWRRRRFGEFGSFIVARVLGPKVGTVTIAETSSGSRKTFATI